MQHKYIQGLKFFFSIYLFSQLFQAFQFFFWEMSNMKTESK